MRLVAASALQHATFYNVQHAMFFKAIAAHCITASYNEVVLRAAKTCMVLGISSVRLVLILGRGMAWRVISSQEVAILRGGPRLKKGWQNGLGHQPRTEKYTTSARSLRLQGLIQLQFCPGTQGPQSRVNKSERLECSRLSPRGPGTICSLSPPFQQVRRDSWVHINKNGS